MQVMLSILLANRPGSMTEYDRRKLLAQKSMDDAVRQIERVKSLSRKSSGPVSPRHSEVKGPNSWFNVHIALSDGHHAIPVPVPASNEMLAMQNEETPNEFADPVRSKDWWRKTEQAFLNEKPDKALEDESTNSQFSRQSYVPQYAVAVGVHVPEYMKSLNKKAGGEVPAV
eukprot:scaffold253844_cov46-Prasinocladus_malaysianus.AAC.1